MKSAIESSSRSEPDDNVPFGRKGGHNKMIQFISRHAGERSLFVDLETVATTSLDHFEKRHRDTGEFVRNAHSRTLPVHHGCSLDTWCALKVGGDELISSCPEGKQKFPHLALIKRPGLANINISGLAHCE